MSESTVNKSLNSGETASPLPRILVVWAAAADRDRAGVDSFRNSGSTPDAGVTRLNEVTNEQASLELHQANFSVVGPV
jgi:hypothetical protein